MKRCSAAASTRCLIREHSLRVTKICMANQKFATSFLPSFPPPIQAFGGRPQRESIGFANKWIPARAPHLPTEAGLAGMAAIHATNLRHTTTSARSRYKPTGVALPAGHCRNSITRPHSRPFRLPTNNERAAVCRDCAARSQGPRRSAPQRDGFPRRLRARTAAAPRPTRRT